MLDLLNEFDRVVKALGESGAPYALIGGLAVAVHGGVRATRDMDFLTTPEQLAKIEAAMLKLGYKRTELDIDFKKTSMSLRRYWKVDKGDDDATVVDFILAKEDWQKDIIRRAEAEDWRGSPVHVARKEDIVRLKAIRGSSKDLADIETLREDAPNGS